jgi:hypothetical protein
LQPWFEKTWRPGEIEETRHVYYGVDTEPFRPWRQDARDDER